MNGYNLQPLVRLYHANANPALAVQMRAYMKGKFNYLGLPSPLRRELTKQFHDSHGYPPPGMFESVVNECWTMPQREYKYFAMELMVKMRKISSHEAIFLYERLLTDESWWDTVDLIAPSLVGYHMQQYPEEREHYVNKWIKSGNIWLQRSCILFQLKYKKETDTRLLSEIILQLSASKEFFIRKAIGWALREFSKTDADYVLRFVQDHKLSGLSHREAIKRIQRQ